MHTCNECDAQCKSDHWNTKKAQREGWFFMRNGDVFCPLHVPDWVEEWRARCGETTLDWKPL